MKGDNNAMITDAWGVGCWRDPLKCHNGLSLSIWIRFRAKAQGSELGILSSLINSQITCGIFILESESGILFGMRNNIREKSDSAKFSYPILSRWTHFVMTLKINSSNDPPEYTIYENAENKIFTATLAAKNNQSGSCDKLVFGRKYIELGTRYSNDVKIDELLIFEHILTKNQVLKIYNA